MVTNSSYINNLLRDFKPLIHKILNRVKINKNHIDYEDFFQELQIKLVEIFYQFNGDPLGSDEDRFKFTAYANNGLYWHTLNLLKQKELSLIRVGDENQLEWMVNENSDLVQGMNTNLHIEDFLNQARKRLTYEDYLLLMFLIEGEYTVNEIAEFLELSLSTIYERKKKIQKRLKNIKGCLEI